MLDRYDAVLRCVKYQWIKKREILIKAFHQETFEAVKTEVVSQLAADQTPETINLLKEALTDKDVAVRKVALKNINPVSMGLMSEFEKLLTDSSYEIIENALQKLIALNPYRTKEYLSLTNREEGNLGRNVKIRWLELSYASTGKKEYTNRLVDLTSNSYEFRTRINAMAALKRLAYFNDALAKNAVEAILSANVRLSGPANDMLKFFFSRIDIRNP